MAQGLAHALSTHGRSHAGKCLPRKATLTRGGWRPYERCS